MKKKIVKLGLIVWNITACSNTISNIPRGSSPRTILIDVACTLSIGAGIYILGNDLVNYFYDECYNKEITKDEKKTY